jgi:hypothetical protein
MVQILLPLQLITFSSLFQVCLHQPLTAASAEKSTICLQFFDLGHFCVVPRFLQKCSLNLPISVNLTMIETLHSISGYHTQGQRHFSESQISNVELDNEIE